MRRAPRSVVAAALVTIAALVAVALTGCGAPADQPVVAVTPPDPLVSQPPVAGAEAAPRGQLAPAVPVAEPPVPTAHYRPVGPPPSTASTPPSGSPSASPTASPSPSVAPTASPTPTPAPTPAPVPLASLLRGADGFAPITWTDSTGTAHTAAWTEVAPPSALGPAAALPHIAAARSAGGTCAAAAGQGDGIEAASVSLTAEFMEGGPVDLVLVRYASPSAAAAAVAALQDVGETCNGVETAEGRLRGGVPLLSATVVLESAGAALVVDATSAGALLIAVLHEGAPAAAVTGLVAAQRAALP